MMQLKPGVRVAGIAPELTLALVVAKSIYAQHSVDLVVTSLVDGKHSRASLHYIGHAADLRTNNLPGGSQGPTAQAIGDQLRRAIGEDYDVVVESDHIHVEFQPKTGLNMR